MGDGRLQWKRAGMAALAALVFSGGFFGMSGYGKAQETGAPQDLLELTAQELQTEKSDASYAHLKIGDWLDYGDYGIERKDIPGTDYLFSITTKDENGSVINDGQLAYCVQSYFLTPLPGEHSQDMTDNVSAVGGSQDLLKVIYYGYGGAGYSKEAFEAFLKEQYPEYFADIYTALSAAEQEELSYILTHGAASYAYFTDGTPLAEYLQLQFELRFGDDWKKPYENFVEEELSAANIEDGDLNLMGATYGMNPEGIAMSKDWYEILTEKEMPELRMAQEGDVYTFLGNTENPELSLTLTIPEDFAGTVTRRDGTSRQADEKEEVTLLPEEQISFVYTGEAAAAEKGALSGLETVVEGSLTGTEKEAWNLVVLQTSKGTAETISKRQQDIAAVSLTDAGRTKLDIAVMPEVGTLTVEIKDEEGYPVSGAAVGVYYDEACSDPVCQDGQEVVLTTDEEGEAYLEFAQNEKIRENEDGLYLKELSAPTGKVPDDQVYRAGADETVSIINAQETTSVSGTVGLELPDGAELPEELTVELLQDGTVIDSMTITEADGWQYGWDGLPKYTVGEDGDVTEAVYETCVTAPEGYVAESADGKTVIKAAEPAQPLIEARVKLSGRDLKDGEFSFVLTQVTDETGKDAVPDGITDTAVNDKDGTIVFDGVACRIPGTYYFAIAEEGETEGKPFIAKAEVTADPDNKGQLAAKITYPGGTPEFEKVYEASGQAALEGIRVTLENQELKEGALTFELRDAEGMVLQNGTNDAEGNILFQPLEYTQEDIGKTYEYSIVLSDGLKESYEYEDQTYTFTVKIEDSDSSDGTLKITQELPETPMKITFVEPETEAESGTESQTEITAGAKGQTETPAQTETETEVSDAKKDKNTALPWGIGAAVLLIVVFAVWMVRRKKSGN